MACAVVMPKAGISVESCVIGQWRKKVGDSVSEGEILFDYETDKATFECESTAAGTLLEIFFDGGEEVPCLTNVCAIGNAGEDISALRPFINAEAVTPEPQAANAFIPAADVTPQPSIAAAVSPRAQKLADRLNIDPNSILPSGPRGRVIERDIQTAVQNKDVTMALQPAPQTASEYTDEKFTQIRKVISAGMTRSLSEMAQLTHHHSFDASTILEFRKQCKSSGAALMLNNITLNDIILFAVSRILKSHSCLNAHLLGGDTIRKYSAVHIGVAMDTPRGLIVPTVFDADKKSLAGISEEVKRLSDTARNGNISPDFLQGATFTVSNLGSTGVEMFTPIINPPQVAILGVCGVQAKVRIGASGIETYQSMGLSLTYDHRAVDGAPASRFAADLCRSLEEFMLLLAGR
ncbi:MAG: 2-oxo acid dehydrogenase subunit E2 [Defluviitaleaceae bacterium]|nr:2-oxo acid dehydrogenase subunit E2 [Defluviitaleaceae bacterium]